MAKWGLGNSRAREKREGGMMGTSVKITQISPSDRERLGTRQVPLNGVVILKLLI